MGSYIWCMIGGRLCLVLFVLSEDLDVGMLSGGVRGGGSLRIAIFLGRSGSDLFCDTYDLKYVSKSYSSVCCTARCCELLYIHSVVILAG